LARWAAVIAIETRRRRGVKPAFLRKLATAHLARALVRMADHRVRHQLRRCALDLLLLVHGLVVDHVVGAIVQVQDALDRGLVAADEPRDGSMGEARGGVRHDRPALVLREQRRHSGACTWREGGDTRRRTIHTYRKRGRRGGLASGPRAHLSVES
jgi:hypothetical protein